MQGAHSSCSFKHSDFIIIDYRQRFFWEELISDYRYRIALPEELISITETDLWEFQPREAETYIFPIFFLFQAGGPKPIL